jgi:hypothetical protein
LWRIGLTGWEIFSKVDAVKSNLNQAEDISPVFFASSRAAQSQNQTSEEKEIRTIMNPLIQIKKATPLFVIALVLACFVLSPQAFGQSTTPTFYPLNWSGCQQRKNVRILSTMSDDPSGITARVCGANVCINVAGMGWVYQVIANNGTVSVKPLGTLMIAAQAFKWNNQTKRWVFSGWGYSTYTCDCRGHQWDCFH